MMTTDDNNQNWGTAEPNNLSQIGYLFKEMIHRKMRKITGSKSGRAAATAAN